MQVKYLEQCLAPIRAQSMPSSIVNGLFHHYQAPVLEEIKMLSKIILQLPHFTDGKTEARRGEDHKASSAELHSVPQAPSPELMPATAPGPKSH